MADGLATFNSLLGPTLTSKNGSVETSSALKGKAVVGLFFSANWCPPCQGFVPKLAETYGLIEKMLAQRRGGSGGDGGFEVVFVSSCREEEGFAAFYETMPWLALPYSDRVRKATLSQQLGIKGLPTLVLFDGATGKLLTNDGRGEITKDPTGECFPWGATMNKVSSSSSFSRTLSSNKSGFLQRWWPTLAALLAFFVAWSANQPKPVNRKPLPPRCHVHTPLQGGIGSPSEPVAEVYQGVEYDIMGGFQGVGKKEFDLVLFGATGFTGKLVAKYLAESFDPSFKWAISGRSPHKLQALHRSLGPIAAASIGVVIVDSNNQSSLDDLMAKTRVVISTTGPYTDLGDPLVRACASNGVHYADLSGEPFWQRDMIEKYDTLARNTGAKIVLASGYDSVPFDLGALHAIRALSQQQPKGGKSSPHVPIVANDVTALVTVSRGWLSGGTLQSGLRTFQALKTVPSLAYFQDPYLLVPQDDVGVMGACRSDVEMSGWGSSIVPRYDENHHSFGIAHFMASINARIVRRSFALHGYRNVTYGEGITLSALLDATLFMVQQVWSGQMPLRDLWPSPGAGPSPNMMVEGRGAIEFVAKNTESGNYVRTEVSFLGDMGYNATSKMLAEAGRCLAAPNCHSSSSESGGSSVPGGGVTTPSAAMGLNLARRLAEACKGQFMTFRILEAGTAHVDKAAAADESGTTVR